MTCEYEGCNSQDGKDYNRIGNHIVKGWEKEPIFLCDEHSNGMVPIGYVKTVFQIPINVNNFNQHPELVEIIDNYLNGVEDPRVTKLLNQL